MLKALLKLVLALVAIVAIAFSVFWFARPADISFDEVRATVPHSEYSRFAEIDWLESVGSYVATTPPSNKGVFVIVKLYNYITQK